MALKDFWEYDPNSNSWKKKADFGGIARLDAVGFSIGSKGYIGTGTDQLDMNDFWEYTPGIAEGCEEPGGATTSSITASSAKIFWNAVAGSAGYRIRYKVTGTSEWTNLFSIDNDKTLTGLSANTDYLWQVKTLCTTDPNLSSGWSAIQTFTTAPLRSGASAGEMVFDVYPDPFYASAIISFSLSQDAKVQIVLLDAAGRNIKQVLDENFTSGDHEVKLNRDHLSQGIYFVKLLITTSGKSRPVEVMMKKVLLQQPG